MAHLYRGEPPVPFDDEVGWPTHEEGGSCWCKPKIERISVDDEVMVVHRTAYEIKLLKMEN